MKYFQVLKPPFKKIRIFNKIVFKNYFYIISRLG